jgi:hypothetical protein
VFALAGLAFGWDKALYATIALYADGLAAEAISEKAIVSETDPHAFVVIGQMQEVYGEGFRQFERR